MLVLLGDIALIFHAGADDVDEGEDAGLGILNDAVPELWKVAPAGGAVTSATVVTPYGIDMGSACTPRSPLPQAL